MTRQVSISVPPNQVVTVHRGQMHRWRLLNGETFLARLKEVIPSGGNAIFEVDQDGRERWLTLHGLMDWELVE